MGLFQPLDKLEIILSPTSPLSNPSTSTVLPSIENHFQSIPPLIGQKRL